MDPSSIAIIESALTLEADSPGAKNRNYEDGISKIQEMFSNIESTSSENMTVPKLDKMDSPLDMIKETVSDYISREHELEIGLRSMDTTPMPTQGSFESHELYRKTMLEMQIAFQEKSINGAMLLSTGKSAEGFVKTLMKSQ